VKIRRIIFWAHLIAGVLAGVVILIMSFTGMCLAFESQLVNYAERSAREIASPAADAKRLSYDVLLEKARVANPDVAPSGLMIRAEPTASVMVNFGREEALYLHPYTGDVLGHGSKIRGVLQRIENWHRWLGATESHRPTARAVTGACNFTFLFLAVSGVYLWWPRNWNAKALRSSVWFVGGLKGRAREWNWHNTIGLWCAPILIILTLTGVVMSYQWANNLVYRLTGNQPPPLQAQRFGGNQRAGERHRHSDADDATGVGESRRFGSEGAATSDRLEHAYISLSATPGSAGYGFHSTIERALFLSFATDTQFSECGNCKMGAVR